MPKRIDLVLWTFAVAIASVSGLPRLADGQEFQGRGGRSGVWYAGQYFGFDPQAPQGAPLVPSADEVEVPSIEPSGEDWIEAEPDMIDEFLTNDRLCLAGTGVYARAEFLWWWMKGMPVPVLATTDPNGGILPEAAVVFGGTNLNDQGLPGGRFTIGKWLDACQCNGVDVSFVTLGQASASFQGSGANFDLLARPFVNVDPTSLGADARVIVDTGGTAGNLSIRVNSNFYMFDALWRRNLTRSGCCTTDLVLGYRHAELSDFIRINSTSTSEADGTVNAFDQFQTRNEFNGFVLGLSLQRQLNACWSCDLLLQGAIGQTHSSLGIAGRTVTTPTGGSSTFSNEGLLAQSTNIGNYATSDLGAMGQFGLNLRRHLACGWSVNVGYNLLLWGDVLRAGSQIDTNINTSQIPPGTLTGDPRPLVPMATSSFWVQGVQFGFERAF